MLLTPWLQSHVNNSWTLHQPKLAWQWNKCVKQCLTWENLLEHSYPTPVSGLTDNLQALFIRYK